MLDERVHVRIEIHPFGLPLLLIDIRHPDQWGATCCKRTPNLWHQQVRDEAREEAPWSKNEEVRLRDCSQRTLSCSH
jgi:hypothetical protein